VWLWYKLEHGIKQLQWCLQKLRHIIFVHHVVLCKSCTETSATGGILCIFVESQVL